MTIVIYYDERHSQRRMEASPDPGVIAISHRRRADPGSSREPDGRETGTTSGVVRDRDAKGWNEPCGAVCSRPKMRRPRRRGPLAAAGRSPAALVVAQPRRSPDASAVSHHPDRWMQAVRPSPAQKERIGSRWSDASRATHTRKAQRGADAGRASLASPREGRPPGEAGLPMRPSPAAGTSRHSTPVSHNYAHQGQLPVGRMCSGADVGGRTASSPWASPGDLTKTLGPVSIRPGPPQRWRSALPAGRHLPRSPADASAGLGWAAAGPSILVADPRSENSA